MLCVVLTDGDALCQVIRVLGLLGALDPHKHRMNMGQDQASEAAVSKSEKKPEEGGRDACCSLLLPVTCYLHVREKTRGRG